MRYSVLKEFKGMLNDCWKSDIGLFNNPTNQAKKGMWDKVKNNFNRLSSRIKSWFPLKKDQKKVRSYSDPKVEDFHSLTPVRIGSFRPEEMIIERKNGWLTAGFRKGKIGNNGYYPTSVFYARYPGY